MLLPAVDSLLLRAEPALRATLAALIGQRPAALPLLVLGTCSAPLQTLPPQLQAELRALFPLDHFELAPPPRPQREALLHAFFDDARLGVPRPAPPPAAPRTRSARLLARAQPPPAPHQVRSRFPRRPCRPRRR